jgi:hypothetical protein
MGHASQIERRYAVKLSARSAAILLAMFVFFRPAISMPLSEQNGRIQVSVGYDSNLYEDPQSPFAAPFLRLQYDRSWHKKIRSLSPAFQLGVWTSLYPQYTQENKIFLHLSGSIDRQWTNRWSTRLTVLARSKYFLAARAGYREGKAALFSLHRLPHQWQIEHSILLDLWRFEQNARYNFNLAEYSLVLLKPVGAYGKMWIRFSASRGWFPAFAWAASGHVTVGQKNRTVLAETGVRILSPGLFTVAVQLANNTSSIPALSFVQWSSQLTAVWKIRPRWYLRSFFQYITKRYSVPAETGSEPFQPDPELGEGNRFTLDAVWLLRNSLSLVLRFQNLHLESVFRNRYYQKRLFEILLEWQ